MADDLTGRKPGYLASIDNTPPLIFRFQINPDILSEKLSYKYDDGAFGCWQFDSNPGLLATAGAGLAAAALPTAALGSVADKLKNYSAMLVNVLPLEAKVGEARTFSIDFSLDARLADVLDEGNHYDGSIEPDLFILRSFMYPSLDLVEFAKWAGSGFKRTIKRAPPLCSLFYAGLSVTCVMTDLNIKVLSFTGTSKPQRADVSVSLKEQTKSISPIIEFMQRNGNVLRSYGRKNIGTDIMNVTPILNLFT